MTHSPDHAERTEGGLFQAIGRYLDARRKRRAWNMVATGIALHPPIADEIVAMTVAARAALHDAKEAGEQGCGEGRGV